MSQSSKDIVDSFTFGLLQFVLGLALVGGFILTMVVVIDEGPSEKKITLDSPITVIKNTQELPNSFEVLPSGAQIRLRKGSKLIVTNQSSNQIVSPRGRAITHKFGYVRRDGERVPVHIPTKKGIDLPRHSEY
jgi:hypothetical protein